MELGSLITNAMRRLDSVFPGYFGSDTKHNHYKDFGWPVSLQFTQYYSMWDRNGVGAAAIRKISAKTFQDNPTLLEKKETHEETTVEQAIREHFSDIRLWQNVAEADRRGMIGRYGALILRIADGRRFSEPVGVVSGGVLGLVEVIPAWEAQLRVSRWDTDEESVNYGKPTMYEFNEAQVGQDDTQRNPRQFSVHPDRVIIFSDNGTVHGESMLKPGYNDLLTVEKVSGSGGEGFWKNAKSAPILNVDKDAKIDKLAAVLGVPVTELKDKLGETVEDWQKGFDKLLMLQGIEAKTLGVTLPSQPEQYYMMALQSFAASIMMPIKILIGTQTGERASTEDTKEFNKTISSRRENEVIPTIMSLINRLESFDILQERDWYLDWEDLTDSTPEEKIERADKMAGINQKMVGTGEVVFNPDEIREAAGYLPLTDEYDDLEDNLDDLEDEEEEDGSEG